MGFVATDVSDDHLLRPRLQALPHHLRHRQGIGVGGLLGSAVPANVGFDHHHVAAGDESPHAPQSRECLLHQGPGILALRHGHFRKPGVSGDGKVVGQRDGRFIHRALAAVVQPDGGGHGGGAQASCPQEFYEHLAPGRGGGKWVFWHVCVSTMFLGGRGFSPAVSSPSR